MNTQFDHLLDEFAPVAALQWLIWGSVQTDLGPPRALELFYRGVELVDPHLFWVSIRSEIPIVPFYPL